MPASPFKLAALAALAGTVVIAGAAAFVAFVAIPPLAKATLPQLPPDGRMLYPVPPPPAPLAETDNGRPLLVDAGSHLTGTIDFKPLQKGGAPDVASFIDANAKFEADNLARLDAVQAAKAKPGLRLSEDREAFAKDVQAIYDLNNLGYLHLEHLLRQGSADDAVKLADGLLVADARLRNGTTQGYNQALQGAYGISGLTLSLRNHPAVFLRAQTPALTALLADLNAQAGQRVLIDALSVAQREYIIHTWQDLAGAAGADPDHFKIGRSWVDRTLARLMVARTGEDTYMRFRSIFDRRITAVAVRDFATLRAGRRPLKWNRPSPLTWPAIEPADFRPLALLLPVEGGLALAIAASSIGDQAYTLLRSDAEFDAWRIRVAAELYKRAEGHQPADLRALVPTYLPTLPIDPFDPARSLSVGNDRIWSVGPDGHDDGGKRSDEFVGDPLTLNAGVDILL